MRKFKKISALALGLVLAVGVGAGIGANRLEGVKAAENVSFTINIANLGGAATYNSYGSGAEKGKAIEGVEVRTKAVMANVKNTPSGAEAGDYMQCQASNGVIYNTAALPGRLVSVVLTQYGTSAHSLYGGSTSRLVNDVTADYTVSGTLVSTQTQSTTTWTISAGTDYTYFCIKRGTSASYISSIVVTYATETPELSSISTSGTLTNASQYEGATLDISGLTVTANYVGGGTATLTSSQLVLPTLVYGTNSYQISYTEGEITVYATVNVTVTNNPVTSLAWTNPVTTYTEGEVLSLGSGAITATYANEATISLTFGDVEIFVYTGAFDVETAATITSATHLTVAEHNGKNIKLGYASVFSNASVLVVTTAAFVPTTTYFETSANLVTDVANLSVGDSVLILNIAGDYALSTTQNGNNRGAVGVSTSGGVLSTIPETAQIMTLEAGTVANTFAFNTGTLGYLYAASSTKNYLRSQTTNDANGNWDISIESGGEATVTAQGANTRNLLRYNSDETLFSAYASGQQNVHIYEVASGYNYNYLLGVLDGDYCSMDLAGLNLVNTRYEEMTAIEKFNFDSEEITGLDRNTYTGLEAYTEAMVRRTALQASGYQSVFETLDENNSIITIVIISLISVTIIAGTFYFRKKQHN